MRIGLPALPSMALALVLALAPLNPSSATASTMPGLPGSMGEAGPDLTGASPVLSHLPAGDGDSRGTGLAVSADGLELSLDGDLAEGVADRVARLLAANPGVRRVRLSSDGGLVEEAEAMGRFVAAHGLSTIVTASCASACSLVYVRGYRRYLGPRGRLGFHGPYVIGFLDKAHPVDPSSERRAYQRAGLGPEFLARALSVGPDGMWFPTMRRLLSEGIVTGPEHPRAAW